MKKWMNQITMSLLRGINGQQKKTAHKIASSAHNNASFAPHFNEPDEIWFPPVSENWNDELDDGLIITLENDDDYSDDEDSNDHIFGWKKTRSKIRNMERQKVKEGKFKCLVRQLLKKRGVEISDVQAENWLDIVTDLAWNAAIFLKPGVPEGKAMDPSACVKIKCVASGSPGESRLIKGLVFTKHVAHKHMDTMYKNPKLLLMRGMLGSASGSSGLSSFSSMIPKDYLNCDHLIKNLAECQPNVILVEKSASRMVLEKILQMGITLVLDMKHDRLERVARCTGSSIFSSDTRFNQNLTRTPCESLYFKKFVEEHANVGEWGRKPSKTLMFMEGCSTNFGCTILLMGSRGEELKRIKSVVQYAVVMAYHFLLETSFCVDQKAMFSTIANENAADISSSNEQPAVVVSEVSSIPTLGEPDVGNSSADGIQVLPSSSSDQDSSSNVPDSAKNSQSVSTSSAVDGKAKGLAEDVEKNTNNISDSESILVLKSSRNFSKGIICEQSHFSLIKYYMKFDIPLGKFLRDHLFNQALKCEACRELPEAHYYYYAHQSKQLTIRVKRLSNKRQLPCESEGKIWMWSRCSKCQPEEGNTTKRVLISKGARCLSFGKFLELSFSSHSTLNRLSSCGHSFEKDFLHFFGYGSMVAMFRYSLVAIYTVSVPPQRVEFSTSTDKEWVEPNIKTVCPLL